MCVLLWNYFRCSLYFYSVYGTFTCAEKVYPNVSQLYMVVHNIVAWFLKHSGRTQYIPSQFSSIPSPEIYLCLIMVLQYNHPYLPIRLLQWYSWLCEYFVIRASLVRSPSIKEVARFFYDLYSLPYVRLFCFIHQCTTVVLRCGVGERRRYCMIWTRTSRRSIRYDRIRENTRELGEAL